MSDIPFRPMLAAKTPTNMQDFNKHLPGLYGSAKLDGIRALVGLVDPDAPHIGRQVVSRQLNAFPSAYVQQHFNHILLHGFDGEFIYGDPTNKNVYQDTYSALMTHNSETPLSLYVFDLWNQPHLPYLERLTLLRERISIFKDACTDAGMLHIPHIVLLEQTHLPSLEAIDTFEQHVLEQGYEGAIVRTGSGKYKNGRSTFNEGYLIKLKRFEDSEAEIIGFEELLHNDNEAEISGLGYTKRSTHIANKRPGDTLGALIVRLLDRPSVVFNIGSGFSAALRKEIWTNQDKWLNRIVKFKHLPYGAVDAPRHPVYLGIRDRSDL